MKKQSKEHEQINKAIKDKYGTIGNFCEIEDHNYSYLSGRIGRVIETIEDFNKFLKPLSLKYELNKDESGTREE